MTVIGNYTCLCEVGHVSIGVARSTICKFEQPFANDEYQLGDMFEGSGFESMDDIFLSLQRLFDRKSPVLFIWITSRFQAKHHALKAK